MLASRPSKQSILIRFKESRTFQNTCKYFIQSSSINFGKTFNYFNACECVLARLNECVVAFRDPSTTFQTSPANSFPFTPPPPKSVTPPPYQANANTGVWAGSPTSQMCDKAFIAIISTYSISQRTWEHLAQFCMLSVCVLLFGVSAEISFLHDDCRWRCWERLGLHACNIQQLMLSEKLKKHTIILL